jgi:predicted metalloprotease with PDZ domain
VRKVGIVLFSLQLFFCAEAQIVPKYINDIFAQKGGVEIFFYNCKSDKSTFLQQQNLAAALYSDDIKVELANQLGVFFVKDSYEIERVGNNSVASNIGLKVGDKIVNFGGIALSSSYSSPFHEESLLSEKMPSFMLTIKRQGNTLEFGGGIKDLPLKEWSDNFLKKYYQSSQ